jgi:hypothetical protein
MHVLSTFVKLTVYVWVYFQTLYILIHWSVCLLFVFFIAYIAPNTT